MENLDLLINPWAYMGRFHNEALDFIIQAESNLNDNRKLSSEETIEVLCDYAARIIGDESKLQRAIHFAFLANLNLAKYDFSQSLDSLNLGIDSKKKIQELMNLGHAETHDLFSNISKLEQKMLSQLKSNKRGTFRETFIVQSCFAIANFSCIYWKNIYKGTGSLWKNVHGITKVVPWKEDVEGALIGISGPFIDTIFVEPEKILPTIIKTVIAAAYNSYTALRKFASIPGNSKTKEDAIKSAGPTTRAIPIKKVILKKPKS